MLLKRLEISGFKSFAKAATLEFPTKITAIVGPNGSGKSNIADAIRWVLGEQSMKHLRGKKGEDLIFGGGGEASRGVARLSKASAALVFDNKTKIFPIEFDELILLRRVYRDGVNDYVLNGSQVRLKDIIELLSKVGLGASQHHIIAQGDSDRILYASPKERKSMVEEALGLKIFELKKSEAERKLHSTIENIKQAESLRREIQPHLKYLATEVDKMKNAAEVRRELETLSQEYVLRELATLKDGEEEAERGKAPLALRIKVLEEELKVKEDVPAETFFDELKSLDAALEAISKKRRALEREIGRLEALPKSDGGTNLGGRALLDRERVRAVLMEIASDLERVSRSGTMEAVRNTIFSTIQRIYGFLESLNGTAGKSSAFSADLGQAREAVAKLESEESSMMNKRREMQSVYEAKILAKEKESATLRAKMEELASVKDSVRNVVAKEERLDALRKDLEMDFAEWLKEAERAPSKVAHEVLSDRERVDLRKRIERLRIKLEEAGGVDEAVLKEHDAAKERDRFLAKELEDLKKAEKSLQGVFGDLETRIEKDFEAGLSKINKLFGDFFGEIFGGGRAEIKMVSPPKRPKDELDESWQEEIEEEPGLDIIVDIPRKRIKSLNMLSGGERALTSIALLFAMSTVNPPPFLVLDETDAALDEANSAKYASMLKDLGRKTQLVVVTHNRETMKAADVLYGVTMGGDGVSKLLSIKLEEAEAVLQKKK